MEGYKEIGPLCVGYGCTLFKWYKCVVSTGKNDFTAEVLFQDWSEFFGNMENDIFFFNTVSHSTWILSAMAGIKYYFSHTQTKLLSYG